MEANQEFYIRNKDSKLMVSMGVNSKDELG